MGSEMAVRNKPHYRAALAKARVDYAAAKEKHEALQREVDMMELIIVRSMALIESLARLLNEPTGFTDQQLALRQSIYQKFHQPRLGRKRS